MGDMPVRPFPATLVAYELAVDDALRRLPGRESAPPDARRISEAFFRKTAPEQFAADWKQESRFQPAEPSVSKISEQDQGPELF